MKSTILSTIFSLLLSTGYSQTSFWKELGPTQVPTHYVANPNTNNCALQGLEGTGKFSVLEICLSNPDEMFLGSASGPLYYTSNGGVKWETRMGNLPFHGVGAIAANDDFSTVYMSVGARWGYGVAKSTDKGKTWSYSALNFSSTPQYGGIVKVLKMHPFNSQKIYAIIGNEVYLTTDGGNTWPMVHQFIDNGSPIDIYDISFKEDDANTVFFTGKGLFRINIVNGQEVWNNVNLAPSSPGTTLDRIKIASLPIDLNNPSAYTTTKGNTFYALAYYIAGSVTQAHLYYTHDAFNTSTLITSVFPPTNSSDDDVNGGRMELWVNPLNQYKLYFGSIYVWEITFNSAYSILNYDRMNRNHYHFSIPLGEVIHADIRAGVIFQKPINGSYVPFLYVANDGGIERINLSNTTIDWIDLSGQGLNGVEGFGIGGSETNPDLFFCGQTHSGLVINTSSGMRTVACEIADGGEAIIDPNDNDIVYANVWSGSESFLYRISVPSSYSYCDLNLKYQGWHLDPVVNGVSETPFHTRQPMMFHPSNSSLLYVAFKDIWSINDPTLGAHTAGRSGDFFTDYPFKYNKISNTLSWEHVKGFDIAPSDINYIYYFNEANWVFKTTTGGGTSWTDITNSLTISNGYITDIAVNPSDKEDVWICNDNKTYGARVLRNVSGAWVNISVGLPDFPVNRLKFLDGTSLLFAGTDAGVYVLDLNNVLSGWQPFNTNLPAMSVNDIDFVYSAWKIRIQTYGVGVWESPLPCPEYLAHIMDANDQASYQNAGTINWHYSDFIIPSGYELTFDNTLVKMPQNARFTIQKGGKLVIKNGAKITNGADNCAYMWDGIYVEADPNLPQIPNVVTGLYPDHGFLVLENCTLEHAYMAVSVGYNNPGGNGLQGGGVVVAEGAAFLNNRFSARFYDFNFSNKSRIRDCNFKCTGSLPFFSDNDGAYSFVSLFGVKDMWLSGNKFENSAPGGDDNPFGSKFRGAGIISVNSTYWVTPSFNPSIYNGNCTMPNGARTTFKGLTHGVFIYNFNNDPTRQAHILDCDFIDISMGIGMNWDTKTNVFGNEFNWTANFDEYPYFSHPNTAIKTDYAEGFTLDGNTVDFQCPNPVTGIHGISINECHPIPGNVFPVNVYKNDLTNANSNGNSLIGLYIFDDMNTSADNITLQFQCNTFSGFNPAVSSNALTGIADQGSPSMPSGNKFTDPCASSSIRLDAPLQASTNYGQYYYELNNLVEQVPVAFSCNPNWFSGGINLSNPCPATNSLTYYCVEGQNGGGDIEYSIRNNFDPFTDALRLIQAGNYADAQTLLPQISNPEEHSLAEFSLNLYLGGSNYFLLTGSQRTQLEGMMQNGNEKVKQSIRNIVLTYTDKPVKETYVNQTMGSYQAMKNKISTDAGRQAHYSVYPNPAQGSFNVRFVLPDGVMEGRVVVRDIFGKIVWEQAINTIMGELQINLSGTNAIYLCSIEGNNRTLFTTKVLINR